MESDKSDEKAESNITQIQGAMDQLQLEDVDAKEIEENSGSEVAKELPSPVDLLPTPPPSEEASPAKEQSFNQEDEEVIGMFTWYSSGDAIR